jgi:homoserine O-acetyltransferase
VPALTSSDQADALACLLERLAIPRVHRIVGASFGGMVGLAFAARHPALLAGLVCIAAAHESHPMASAWRGLQRRIVDLVQGPGRGCDAGMRKEALAIARGLAMTTYRSHEEFAARFTAAPQPRDGGFVFPVDDYLRARGAEFAERIPPEVFQSLSLAIDLHHVDPATIRTPTLLIGISTDRLVPATQVAALATALGAHGRFLELESAFGHDGFLKEVEALTRILEPALAGELRS